MLSPLPWKVSNEQSIGTKEFERDVTAWNDDFVITAMEDDAEYIVKVCNLFPQVVEALRMVLHDTTNGFLMDKAEEIMSNGYSVLIKNKIETPNFYKQAKEDNNANK